jgi:hypothetical protein
MKRLWIVALIATLVVVALAACGGGNTASAPTTEPVGAPTQASEQAEPTVAPVATVEMAEPTAEPEPTSAPEEADLSLDSRDTGLDQLTSYRVSWKSAWETTKDGKTQQTTWDWNEEYTADPKALHLIWKSTEDGVDKGSMELWQIGDTMYMQSTAEDGTTNCSSFSSSDPESGLQKGAFSPSMLGSLSGAKYVGRENVNGIATKHYKYDEKAASLVGFGKASGDTWVASDGGYVVKDQVNWEGGPGLFGAGTATGESGKGSWTWELTDPNGSFTITPPEGCESAAKGLPIMPDATEKATMGDLTIYKTASKSADVVAFYQKEMAAAGWQPTGEPTSMEGFATLEFAKDNQKASITITSEGEGSQVMINVSKEQ